MDLRYGGPVLQDVHSESLGRQGCQRIRSPIKNLTGGSINKDQIFLKVGGDHFDDEFTTVGSQYISAVPRAWSLKS